MRIDGQNLTITSGGDPVVMLRATLAPLAGVRVTAAAAWNLAGAGPGGGLVSGLGVGTLRLSSAGALAWQEPGAAAAGDEVDVSAGGDFVLPGFDPDAWLAVTVDEDWLQHGVAAVELEPTFNNPLAETDVDIAAVTTETFTVTLGNASSDAMNNLTAWLESATPANRWITLAFGAGAYSRNFGETAALAAHGAQTIASAGTLALHVRRLPVTPGASWRRAVRLRISWDDGMGGRAHSAAIGLYRCRGSAQHEAFQRSSSAPDAEHDDAAISGALPLTLPAALSSGEYHHAVALRNPYGIVGGVRNVQRVTVAAGAQQANAPEGDLDVRLEQRAGGVTRVHARFALPQESDRRPSEWALWYTTNGSTPGSGSPNVTATLTRSRRGAVWQYDLPAQTHGTQVRVLVKVRKSGPVYQIDGQSRSLTIRRTGPLAPAGAGAMGSGR